MHLTGMKLGQLAWSRFQKLMASSRLSLFLSVFVHALLFLSSPVCSNEDEDDLFQGLNNFRESLSLKDLTKNDNAGCLADEIADELEGEPCSSAGDYPIEPGNGPKFPNFEHHISVCHINNDTTSDGIILPVCVPNLDPDLVLNNFTHTKLARFLNDSKYTGAGVGSENDWMVVVLTTDSSSGSFSGAAASLVAVGMVHYMVAFFLGLFLVILL